MRRWGDLDRIGKLEQQIDAYRVIASELKKSYPNGYVFPNTYRQKSKQQVLDIFRKYDDVDLEEAAIFMDHLAGADVGPYFKEVPSSAAHRTTITNSPDGGGTGVVAGQDVVFPTKPGARPRTRLELLYHEVGHWAFQNILPPSMRLEFLEALREFYDADGKLDMAKVRRAVPGADERLGAGRGDRYAEGNATANPQELWAQAFSRHAAEHAQRVRGASSLMTESYWKRAANFVKAFFDRYVRRIEVPERIKNLFKIVLPDEMPTREPGVVSPSRTTTKTVMRPMEEPTSGAGALPIIAKAAAEYANELHFNYADVPLYVQKLRKAPLVGAASPFVTWAYKAVDMPAKPGLMSAVYGSTGGIPFRSNSAALLKRQVKSALALGARRFITQATLRQTLDEDRDFLSRIATYGGTTAAPALWAGNDPRYREMVPLQSLSLSEGSLTLAKTGLLGIYGIVNAVDKDISNQPRAKGDKRKLLRTTDRIRAGKFISPREMLDLVGLGGGFFNDLYRDLTDPKYGTEASVDEIFARHAINATAYLFGGTIADTGALAKALLDPTSQMTSYGRRASTGMIRESIAGWYAREMIGLGMARMDISKITAKDLGRVKSSLVKQRLSPLRKEYKAAAEQLQAAEERGDAVQVRALAAKQAELRETMQAAGDEIGEIMEPYIEWVQTRQAELAD